MSWKVLSLALLLAAALVPPAAAQEPARDLFDLLPPDARAKSAPAVSAAAVDERPILLHVEALAGEPRLPLPDGAVYDLARTGLERRGPESFVWRGKVLVPGRTDGSATLTVEDGRMAGTIFMPDALYQIRPSPDGGHRLVELDPGRFPPCSGAEVPMLPPTKRAAPNPGKAASRLDVLAVYTPAARNFEGGARTMRQQIQHAVDVANTAFANSQIDLQLHLVHVQEIPYTESNNASQDLGWLRTDRTVAALRRTWGADLVTMFARDLGDSCGVGYLMTRSSLSPLFSAAAFSAVRTDCAAANITLAHEVGHNLSANHDPANGIPREAAAFPYAYGHYVDGSFRTVMSYSTECALGCFRIPYFSHPGLTYNGHPVGIAGERDNHRAINQTRELAAGFQASQACRPGPHHLCLMGGRFKVELVWENQYDGSSGVGAAIPRTDIAGFFTFGDASNVELMVKVLDFGDVVKLFYGQLTDLRFSLIVTDTRTGAVKTYGNTRGECGSIDQSAFVGGNRSLTTAKASPCRPGPRNLCLMGNRFHVAVDWRNPGDGTGGQASAVPLSGLTGAFYFGDRNNLELLVKVLDLGRIDVFYGTLSDLEYTITVTDTATGAVKTYQNPAGSFCGGHDDAAF